MSVFCPGFCEACWISRLIQAHGNILFETTKGHRYVMTSTGPQWFLRTLGASWSLTAGELQAHCRQAIPHGGLWAVHVATHVLNCPLTGREETGLARDILLVSMAQSGRLNARVEDG